MSLISPTLAERIEQARQAQLRARKAAADTGWRQGKSGRQDRYARWHVEETVEQDSENWLLSYLDLITLLLALLVVLLALTGADEGLLTRILRQVPPREAAVLRSRLNNPGALRLSDIREAQEQLLETARRLAADGTIVIHGSRSFAAAA